MRIIDDYIEKKTFVPNKWATSRMVTRKQARKKKKQQRNNRKKGRE